MNPKLSALTALLGPVILISGCVPDLCGNEIQTTAFSPDGQFRAVLFERNCGATTDYVIAISVLKARASSNGPANAMSAASTNGFMQAKGKPWAEFQWTGPRDLLVKYGSGVQVNFTKPVVEGVRISYEQD